ncbi:MAG: hypothetical protein R3C20_17820 [Planctomycetaceae bacterium]
MLIAAYTPGTITNLFAHRHRRRSAVMIMFVAFSGFLRGRIWSGTTAQSFILAAPNMQGHAKADAGVDALESICCAVAG